MTVLASTIECASVKLPWQPVLKLLSSPTFILLGKSPQLTSALSNGWWEVIVWADAVQNKKYIILNMHQILNFLAVADLLPYSLTGIFFALLYFSYLQVFHNIQMLPIRLLQMVPMCLFLQLYLSYLQLLPMLQSLHILGSSFTQNK